MNQQSMPLHLACAQGRTETVKLLLNDDESNQINEIDTFGWTPLWIACLKGHLEIVKLLLNDSRIDVNKPRDNHVSSLIMNEKDEIELVNTAKTTAFWAACCKGHNEIVEVLLNDERIDLEKANRNIETPFYVACLCERIEVIKLLLNDKRVDVNKANKSGSTAFYVACLKGFTDVVKLLLNDDKVNINKANADGETPLYLVCWSGHLEIVKYILASPREINLQRKTYNGISAIEIAKKRGRLEIVELLESFERNPIETRTKLRNQLGLSGKRFI